MTLHEAIEIVIKEHGKPMDASSIAKEINRRNLYRRQDNNPVPSSQIHARIKNYPHLFEKKGGLICLIGKYDISNILDRNDGNRSTENEVEESHNKFQEIKPNLSLLNKALKDVDYRHLLISIVNNYSGIIKTKDAVLQLLSLVFIFRFKSLIQEGIITAEYVDIETHDNCLKLNPENQEELIAVLTLLNKNGYLKGLFNPFFHTLQNQIPIHFGLVILLLREVPFSYKRMDSEQFGKWFFDFMNSYLIQKNDSGYQFSSSPPLVELISGLAKNEIETDDVIFDPAIGFGSFFTALNRKIDGATKLTVNYVAQELNEEVLALCKMNLIMNGVYKSSIYVGDSLIEPKIKTNAAKVAISDLPFISANKLNQPINKKNDYLKIRTSDSTSQFIQLIVSRLTDKGVGFITVPGGFLKNNNTMKLRKALVNSDLIDYIVELPVGIVPKSQSEIYLLVLRKNKPEYSRNKIVFYKLGKDKHFQIPNSDLDLIVPKFSSLLKYIIESQKITGYSIESESLNPLFYSVQLIEDILVKKTIADNVRIEKNNFILDPELYEREITRQWNYKVDYGEPIFALRNLITTSNPIMASINELNKYGAYSFIRAQDLSENPQNPVIDLSRISSFEKVRAPFGKILNKSSILIAKYGYKLKPTFLKIQKNPAIISESIYSFEIIEDLILPEYFIYQLKSEVVQEQINLKRRGKVIPYLRKSDFLDIKIPVPILSEQINRVAEYKKQQLERLRLTHFINDIKLIEDAEGLKVEIETFARKYFTNADTVLFRTDLEFDKFPFSSNDLSSGIYIKSSYDKLIKHLLIIDQGNNIHGILSVPEENEISSETYSEINAYANFLIKTVKFIKQSTASNMLAKFAHSSKNFFVGLSMDVDSIINSENTELKNQLEKLYIDRDDVIQRLLEDGESNIEEFIAMNKLRSVREKISKVAGFYKKTSTLYKAISENQPEEFDLFRLISDSDFNNCVRINCSTESLPVYAKKASLNQAFADLIQNSYQYSENRVCFIKVEDKSNYISVQLSNSVNCNFIISKEKYEMLGKTWLTKESGDGASSGVYWASQAITDSMGEFQIADYDYYLENKIFLIDIKLRRRI